MSAWNIFVITFFLGLGGAISPGALLTYTIFESLQKGKKAYISGFLISMGHAAIEITFIFLLLLGLAPFLENLTIITSIGLIGSVLLLYFGFMLFYQIVTKKISTEFLNFQTPKDEKLHTLENSDNSNKEGRKEPINEMNLENQKFKHPFWGGIIFLISNPFWWIWWLTVGLSIMVENKITFATPGNLAIFIFGKELGQIIWYTSISIAIGVSRNFITKKIYISILILCAAFMFGYGIYLFIITFQIDFL